VTITALIPIIILALIQGITEFLPISSSGHLVLAWKGFDQFKLAVPTAEADRLLLDIAAHVGTLGAVMLYYWRDVGRLIKGAALLAIGRWSQNGKLFLLLVLATIPVVIAGYAMKAIWGSNIRSAEIIAYTSIGFGLLLYAADRICLTVRTVEHTSVMGALFMGFAQVLALVPGTSRSGITMTAARALGYERTEAARFSMLMSIPTIIGAGLLAGKDLYDTGNTSLSIDALILAGLSFVAALIAIALMIVWLRRSTFTPFVIYRVLLGLVILYLIYFAGVQLDPPA
jgi:undecaprenyl-diphosphatase